MKLEVPKGSLRPMGVQDCHTVNPNTFDKLPLLSPPWGEIKSNAWTETGCSTMHFGIILNFPLSWIVTLTDTLTVDYAALPAQYLSKSVMSTTAFILITFKKNWVKLQILTSWRSKNSPSVLATRVFSIKFLASPPVHNILEDPVLHWSCFHNIQARSPLQEAKTSM